MNLGIIGAENSHTAAIAHLLNVEKLIKGFVVSHVWGETAELAEKAAEAGEIPTIVADPAEMIGQVDCVMIDHRDGKHHVAAARPFLKAGLPIFIDKPLSTSLAEARSFLKTCAAKGVPVTSLSAIPLQACVARIKKELAGLGEVKAVHLNGPGDYKSPYGGIWFYGIHQVDLMIELLGPNPLTAQMLVNGKGSTAVIHYPKDLTVTLSFVAHGVNSFSLSAVGTEAGMAHAITYDDNIYLASARVFTKMFRTGQEPLTRQRMLAPLAVLEAMQKSLERHAPVKVSLV